WYGFPLRPLWADVTLGIAGSVAVLLAVGIANSYPWPSTLAQRYAQENNIAIPPGGLQIATGIAFPVLIGIGIAIVMSFLATRRQFGRYVYSIGGNPDAAALAGITTRWTIMKTFVAMGMLAAIAAAVTSARLNAATSALGTGVELQVIAAAVIGGTSFSGGIGTIAGGVLGAVTMQSLSSGMVLIGVDTAWQDIVIGLVLVAAVGVDTLFRLQRAAPPSGRLPPRRHRAGWSSNTGRPVEASTGSSRSTPSIVRMNNVPPGSDRATAPRW